MLQVLQAIKLEHKVHSVNEQKSHVPAVTLGKVPPVQSKQVLLEVSV